MNNNFGPKGRRGLPDQLRNFGRHLVYSEGTKTEPYYVENIKKCIASKYMVMPNDIQLVYASEGKSLNTIGLAKYAIKDVNNRLKNGEMIDHVWIFYDKDSFPKSHYDNAYKMINDLNIAKNDENIPCDARGIAWHSLPSNQCFELFLICYFHLSSSALVRTQYADMIDAFVHKKNKTFEYKKNLENIHSELINSGGSIKKAIANAKKLEKDNDIDNPSSKAYRFLEYFRLYLE